MYHIGHPTGRATAGDYSTKVDSDSGLGDTEDQGFRDLDVGLSGGHGWWTVWQGQEWDSSWCCTSWHEK